MYFKVIVSMAFAFLAVASVSASPVNKSPQDNPYPQELDYIGSSDTKEFYITKLEANSADFAHALHHTCRNLFGMRLASVESEEEFAVIDKWLLPRYNSSNALSRAWTSGLSFGSMSKQWASTGTVFNLPNAVISYPWPPGGSASPSWSWNSCLSVYTRCNRSPGAPPGCFPLRTEFFWDDCTIKRPVICQRIMP